MAVSGRRKSCTSRDEGVEEHLLLGTEQLRMPLDPHAESAGSLRRFYDPVGASSGDLQRTWMIDGLVVGAVHLHHGAEDRLQSTLAERDRVVGRSRVGGLLVIDGVGQGVGNVLMQCAAGCHSESLETATDSQHRYIVRQAGSSEVKLGEGSVFVGCIESTFHSLSVVPRMNVERSACEQDTRKCTKEVGIGLGGGRHEEDMGTSPLQGHHQGFLAHHLHAAGTNARGGLPCRTESATHRDRDERARHAKLRFGAAGKESCAG